jgi:hypothetical protein
MSATRIMARPRRGARSAPSRLLLAVTLACCGSALLCAALNVDENGEPCTNTINGEVTGETTTTEQVARRSLRQLVTTVIGCNNIVSGYGTTVHGNGNVLAANKVATVSTTTTTTTTTSDGDTDQHFHYTYTLTASDIPATVTGDYNTIESNSAAGSEPALVVNGSHVTAVGNIARDNDIRIGRGAVNETFLNNTAHGIYDYGGAVRALRRAACGAKASSSADDASAARGGVALPLRRATDCLGGLGLRASLRNRTTC